MTFAAAFRLQKNVDGRRPLGSAAHKGVNHLSAALPLSEAATARAVASERVSCLRIGFKADKEQNSID
jgi:hypothetical protein